MAEWAIVEKMQELGSRSFLIYDVATGDAIAETPHESSLDCRGLRNAERIVGLQGTVDRLAAELGVCHGERISLGTRCAFLRETLDDARAIIADLRKGAPSLRCLKTPPPKPAWAPGPDNRTNICQSGKCWHDPDSDYRGCPCEGRCAGCHGLPA